MILLGFGYSVPPARLKDRPVGGLMANALGYGLLVPVSVPGFLHHFDAAYLYMVAYFFVTVAAEYLLTIIPDREGDKRTGKITLAAFQTNRPIIFAGIIFLVVSLYSAAIIAHGHLMYISIISIILYVAAFVFNRNGIILFACRFPILLLTVLAGVSFPTYLVFIIALLILSRIYYRWRFGIIYPKLW